MISQLTEPEAMSTEQLVFPEISNVTVQGLVRVFKLLSDETRLRILYYLTHKEELQVRAWCELLEQSQPAVSHHLAMLRHAGLIKPRKEGKHNFYRIQRRRFEQAMNLLFSAVPNGSHVRFDDHVLSYEPADDEEN